MGVVCLLESLLSSCLEITAADRDDVVTTVGRGVVDGLVLAHQDDGD